MLWWYLCALCDLQGARSPYSCQQRAEPLSCKTVLSTAITTAPESPYQWHTALQITITHTTAHATNTVCHTRTSPCASVKSLHSRAEIHFSKTSKAETPKLKYENPGVLRAAPDGMVRRIPDHVEDPYMSEMSAETVLGGFPTLPPRRVRSFDTNPR